MPVKPFHESRGSGHTSGLASPHSASLPGPEQSCPWLQKALLDQPSSEDRTSPRSPEGVYPKELEPWQPRGGLPQGAGALAAPRGSTPRSQRSLPTGWEGGEGLPGLHPQSPGEPKLLSVSRLRAHARENLGSCRGGDPQRGLGVPQRRGPLTEGGGPRRGALGRGLAAEKGALEPAGWVGEAPQKPRSPDGLGLGARMEVNSLRVCHLVFLTTLCSQKRKRSWGTCSPQRGPNWAPSASHWGSGRKGPRGSRRRHASKSCHPERPALDRALRVLGIRRKQGPAVSSVAKAMRQARVEGGPGGDGTEARRPQRPNSHLRPWEQATPL